MRKIIHIDMDAFYAAVEQRDNPELRNKPVVVGGPPDSRGVVATCSYEARNYGIHSAMASAHAFRLCPGAVFVQPRFDLYRSVSRQIHAIFHRFSDRVEPLSLDEAFIDVTVNRINIASATHLARMIKKAIHNETGLTASAGVSYNKFLAKVASDINKPDGLTVVPPDRAEDFIRSLPIRKFYGIGPVTESIMNSQGIFTGADLQDREPGWLLEKFGRSGKFYYQMARGIDLRPVCTQRRRKSLGKETTLPVDIDDIGGMLSILAGIATQIESLMAKKHLLARTLTLKLKYQDFQIVTRSKTLRCAIRSAQEIMEWMPELLRTTDAGKKKVRLLGISLSSLVEETDETGSSGSLFCGRSSGA